jgi:hypothetical protein
MALSSISVRTGNLNLLFTDSNHLSTARRAKFASGRGVLQKIYRFDRFGAPECCAHCALRSPFFSALSVYASSDEESSYQITYRFNRVA